MISTKQLLWRIYFKYNRSSKLYRDNTRNINRNKRIGTDRYIQLKKILQEDYNDWGIKTIAKKYSLSYTNTRSLLKFLEIEIRQGTNVIIPTLKESRKNKAYEEHKTGKGWFNPNIRRKIEKYNARGIQGYYFNVSQQKLVWLRSSYEYIFAKWLDKTKQNWKIEETCYKIDGCTYRPDFFIYDEARVLTKIVEIKGYWDSNSHKAIKLNEILRNVDVIMITDISKFIENNSSYGEQLKEWKEKRILSNG